MKKRKELNALVESQKVPGAGSRMKKSRKYSMNSRGRGGEQSLLQSDSEESSEVEEFALPITISKRHRSPGTNNVSTCALAVGFVLMVGCIASCCGLLVVYLGLQTELKLVKQQVVAATSSDSSSQVEVLQKKLGTLTKQSETRHSELSRNLSSLQTQVGKLNKSLIVLKTACDKNSASLSNPADISTISVSKSLASLESGLKSAQTDISNLEAANKQQNNVIHFLKSNVSKLNNESGTLSRQGASSLEAQNSRKDQSSKVDEVMQRLGNLEIKLSQLQTSIETEANSRVNLLALVDAMHTNLTALMNNGNGVVGAILHKAGAGGQDSSTVKQLKDSIENIRGELDSLKVHASFLEQNRLNNAKTKQSKAHQDQTTAADSPVTRTTSLPKSATSSSSGGEDDAIDFEKRREQ